MELVILALLTATGKVWILAKILGLPRLLRLSIYFDVFFTFALPVMFFGTFSGAILAVLSGLWFTFITWFLKLFVKYDRPNHGPYGSARSR